MDEHLKQPLLFGAMAGAATVIVYQVLYNSGFGHQPWSFAKMAIGLGLGLVLGGTVFGITYAMLRNR